MSRFLSALGAEPHLSLLREVFDAMGRRLGEAVGDLGAACVGDASHLSAPHVRSGKKNADGLPEAAGGRKEYTDDEGKVTKVVEWFGYKFHLLVDRRHEVALSYRITSTKTGDNEVLAELVQEAQGNLPTGRIKTLAYDKACDDEKVHAMLDGRGIAPVIENCSMWQGEQERMLPGRDGSSNASTRDAAPSSASTRASRSSGAPIQRMGSVLSAWKHPPMPPYRVLPP